MGMINSFTTFVTSTFDTATKVVKAADETVDVVADMVHVRAVVHKDTDRMTVVTQAAKQQAQLKAELESDESAAAIFEDLMKKL